MTSKEGMLIVYSGPSGVGKGTLIEPIIREYDMVFSVSLTTRAPRPGEVDGVNYSFVSRGEFERMIESGDMLEYACYNGNYYGTPRKAVSDMLQSGRDVVLEIEVQGAMQVRESFPQAVFVFVVPPSMDALRDRLSGRGTEQPEEVARRLGLAVGEMSMSVRYDYIIINDDIETARGQLRSIIEAARLRACGMKTTVDEVIKT